MKNEGLSRPELPKSQPEPSEVSDEAERLMDIAGYNLTGAIFSSGTYQERLEVLKRIRHDQRLLREMDPTETEKTPTSVNITPTPSIAPSKAPKSKNKSKPRPIPRGVDRGQRYRGKDGEEVPFELQ